MRVAAVDIGTNTVLLLVAELREGEPVAVEERAEITRLGFGVDREKRLDPAAIARTLEVLAQYAERGRALGAERVAAVATSAARDSSNGPSFVARATEILGGEVAVASGVREARLTFRGALGGLALRRGARVGVIDVGGGSTELVIGRVHGEVEWAHSYDVGSVRLTERHVRDDPPSLAALDAVGRDAQAAFGSVVAPPGELAAVVAIAGTATSYAAIDLGLVDYASSPPHGHRLKLARLRGMVTELSALRLETRRRRAGLEPKRADVIVAGGIVLSHAAGAFGADELIVSDRGVRWGLAAELFEQGESEKARDTVGQRK